MDIDGARLHYHHFEALQDAAGKPALLFLHGASGNAYDSMMAFRDSFEGQYELIFLDRPGLGFSERDEAKHGSLPAQAELIDAFLAKLGVDEVVVVGHSLGGAVTAALGLAAPDRVKGMAFLAPVSHVWPGGVNWYYTLASLPVIGTLFCQFLVWPTAKFLAPAAIANVFYPDPVVDGYGEKIQLERLFHPKVFRANARDITGLKKSIMEQSRVYSTLRQPSLAVSGTEDTVVWPSIHCEGLMQDLPHMELLMLDGVGHMPHLTHTGQIVRALERLIQRVKVSDDVGATPGLERAV